MGFLHQHSVSLGDSHEQKQENLCRDCYVGRGLRRYPYRHDGEYKKGSPDFPVRTTGHSDRFNNVCGSTGNSNPFSWPHHRRNENMFAERMRSKGKVRQCLASKAPYINAAMALYSAEQVISASTTLSEEEHGQSAYNIVTKRGVGNQPWQAIVHLTPQATPSERRAAFSFNLNCLDKLGGCKDSSDLLPSVWRETKSMSSLSDQ